MKEICMAVLFFLCLLGIFNTIYRLISEGLYANNTLSSVVKLYTTETKIHAVVTCILWTIF